MFVPTEDRGKTHSGMIGSAPMPQVWAPRAAFLHIGLTFDHSLFNEFDPGQILSNDDFGMPQIGCGQNLPRDDRDLAPRGRHVGTARNKKLPLSPLRRIDCLIELSLGYSRRLK